MHRNQYRGESGVAIPGLSAQEVQMKHKKTKT
jgi:hypothetical protein